MKLKCKFDLPETGKPCWNKEAVVFDGDSVFKIRKKKSEFKKKKLNF